MNEKVRVQDDLFEYVNGEWLETAVIPDDKPATGGFNVLADDVEETLINDFNHFAENLDQVEDPLLKKAVQLYLKVKDTKKRNKDGIKPVLKTLNKIESLKSIRSLNLNLKDFVLQGIPLPFTLGVEADMKDTSKYSLMIFDASTILPDTSYYKPGMEQQKEALLGLWKNMALQLMSHTKLSKEDQKQFVEDALAFDEKLAELVKSQEECADYVKMYNPFKFGRVAGMLKPLNFKKVVTELFGTAPEEVILMNPRFVKGFKSIFTLETFEMYKHWAYVTKLISDSSLLSEELRAIGSSYRNALMGVASLPTIEKQAYRLASSYFDEPVGLYYGKKYFGEEAKKDVVEMVYEIIDTYKKRVRENDFLKEATKEKAIIKLDKMVVKMGYPDKVDPVFSKFDVLEEDSLFECLKKIGAVLREDIFAKLYQPLDRTKWAMPGHMVNACYNAFTNDITFPAGILQAPFYSIKQSRSENLGGIGAVIGHEISHAFDNNGAQFDENGNLSNWWDKEDFKQFKARTKAMIKEFDGIVLPQGTVNGAFVVSENIADNGGMAVTLDIMKSMKDKDYEAYFYNWARVWSNKQKPEYAQLLLSIDVHSPAYLRANMQPRNFDEWYETFNVKKTDKMYLAPNKRVHIW